MIELINFSKKYHQRTVLDIDKWSFEKGIYLLKGINGSGKSTLLQSIAARLSFGGQITVEGNSVKRSPSICRAKVSYAGAEPLFPEFLTGRHLLAFFEKTKGRSSWELAGLLDGFSADEFLDKPTVSYSSGMLKKLSLLLAFCGRPEWILLDEPYNALDLASQETLSAFVQSLFEKFQIGFFVASHQRYGRLENRSDQLQTLLLENGKISTI